MNKKTKIVVFICVIVLLFWLNVRQRGLSKPAGHADSAPPAQKNAEKTDGKETTAADEYRKLMDLVKTVQTPAQGPLEGDPFLKFNAVILTKDTPLEINQLKLTGIIIEEDGPVALINDQILRAGDVISKFQIEEIRQNEVLLKRGTDKFVLRLFANP